MRTLRRYIGLYKAYFRANLLSLMSYRLDFIIRNTCNLILILASLGVVGLVYENVESIKGWRFEQVLVIYALTSMSRSLFHLFCINVVSIGTYVRQGDLDRILLRPVNPLFQLVADYLDNDDWGELVLGIGLLAYSFRQAGLPLDFRTVLWVLVIAVCGSAIYFAIHLAFSTSGFWIVQNKPIEQMAWELDRFTTYPVTVYAPALRFVLTWLIPLGFVAFYPAECLFVDWPSGLGFLTPAVAAVSLAAAYRLWLYGLSKYQGTGS